MTDAPAAVWATPPAPEAPPAPAPRARVPWCTVRELREGLLVVLALAVIGAVLGVVWQWWSLPGPLAGVLPGHQIQPDETEAFVAADGRYAVIVASVGLIAGIALWLRRELRGPVAAVALLLGGLAGGLLTEYVGRALDGGKSDGPVNTLIKHLRLDLHMHGLRVLEPLVAILVYSLIVAFAPTDDLGRGDSVEADGHAQDGGGDGDAASGVQQAQFAPQEWDREA